MTKENTHNATKEYMLSKKTLFTQGLKFKVENPMDT